MTLADILNGLARDPATHETCCLIDGATHALLVMWLRDRAPRDPEVDLAVVVHASIGRGALLLA